MRATSKCLEAALDADGYRPNYNKDLKKYKNYKKDLEMNTKDLKESDKNMIRS
jgi:hypothetical protein